MKIYLKYYDFYKHPKYNIKTEYKPQQEIDEDMRYQIDLIFKNVVCVIWIKEDIQCMVVKNTPQDRE
jgi:hypothetical protein